MSMSKNVAHTSARGVEPYDKCFGVGVHKKLESGGFSPYPRIERIREMYKTSPLFLDSGRALAFTAAYKEYEEAQPLAVSSGSLARKASLMLFPFQYSSVLRISSLVLSS